MVCTYGGNYILLYILYEKVGGYWYIGFEVNSGVKSKETRV